ncbi:MAG: hypothetical protein R3Y61_03275 [Rikenellaceae bacterium]
MLLLTVSEFRANISKYLAMAATQPVAIKSKSGVFNIMPSEEIQTLNPSPSNDPWFDVPENMESVRRGSMQAKMGLGISLDELRAELGL